MSYGEFSMKFQSARIAELNAKQESLGTAPPVNRKSEALKKRWAEKKAAKAVKD